MTDDTIKLKQLDMETIDIRFKRIKHNPSVVEKIYKQMISERQQNTSKFRSEGEGEAARNFSTDSEIYKFLKSSAEVEQDKATSE